MLQFMSSLGIKNSLILLFFISIIFSNCRNYSTDTVANTDSELDASFADFYEKFHEDSVYQIKHIDFPLLGIPNMVQDEKNLTIGNFEWQKKDWKAHKKVDFKNSVFKQELISLGGIIIERIFDDKGFGMERRFSKNKDGEWALIYYAGMNFVKK